MPGHIREFNRLKPHSSHDLVFKIWRNNKTEATLRVFCLWLWVTRNQISMGTTGKLISKNIKFKILPSINTSFLDSLGFFALKTNQKNRHFCMDFHLRRLSPKDYNQSLQKSRTVPPDIVDISRLPLKPQPSFKPKNVIKTGFFVFHWMWPKPVRGSQREENSQKTSLKAEKNSPRFGRHLFYFSKLVFQFSLTVLLFLPHVCFI